MRRSDLTDFWRLSAHKHKVIADQETTLLLMYCVGPRNLEIE